LNKTIEVSSSYYPMLGFGAFESAKRYRQAFDEVRNYSVLQPDREFVCPSEKRQLFVNRVQQLQSIGLA